MQQIKGLLVRKGSLVMWNVKASDDYGELGVVTSVKELTINEEFDVVWADGTATEYDHGQIQNQNIKVVKF